MVQGGVNDNFRMAVYIFRTIESALMEVNWWRRDEVKKKLSDNFQDEDEVVN